MVASTKLLHLLEVRYTSLSVCYPDVTNVSTGEVHPVPVPSSFDNVRV